MDLIDRQATLDELYWLYSAVSVGNKPEVDDFIQRIKAQPTVEPKRGEWIEPTVDLVGNVVFILHNCSACGNASITEIRQGNEVLTVQNHYCHNCGADMRGESNVT